MASTTLCTRKHHQPDAESQRDRAGLRVAHLAGAVSSGDGRDRQQREREYADDAVLGEDVEVQALGVRRHDLLGVVQQASLRCKRRRRGERGVGEGEVAAAHPEQWTLRGDVQRRAPDVRAQAHFTP